MNIELSLDKAPTFPAKFTAVDTSLLDLVKNSNGIELSGQSVKYMDIKGSEGRILAITDRAAYLMPKHADTPERMNALIAAYNAGRADRETLLSPNDLMRGWRAGGDKPFISFNNPHMNTGSITE